MIFGLAYALLTAGYGPFNYWLGNYMVEYTGAQSELLGVFFIIHPITFMMKPIICSMADRHHAHKIFYIFCLLGVALVYTPFVLAPFLLEPVDAGPGAGRTLHRTRFWLLALLHLVGSVFYNGCRSLTDVLTVNYSRRINSDFGRYRKYGALCFGAGSFLISFVNVGAALPNYVAGILLFVLCHLLLTLIVYAWPNEFFVILSESQLKDETFMSQRAQLESICESWKQVGRKLWPCYRSSTQLKGDNDRQIATEKTNNKATRHLGSLQQLKIFFLLARMDRRIPLQLALLLVLGVTGFSGQHFLQVSLKSDCPSDICDSSLISGYLMGLMSLSEFLTIVLYNKIPLADTTRLQIQILISCLQYLGLYYLTNLSPYFYLVGSLHGAEALIVVMQSVEKGRSYADEVEYILDELKEQSIINDQDDMERVRVSLAATMIALLITCSEGIGAAFGRLTLGFLIGQFGYRFAWLLLAILASIVLAMVIVSQVIAPKLGLNPKIADRISASRQDETRCQTP